MLPESVCSIWLRIRALIYRRRLERDLAEELSYHVAMRAAKLASEGVPQAEARASARRRFGNFTRVRENCREMWTFAWLETVGQDLRYGLRALGKAPAFSGVAILSLAFGIGANTALFSLIDTMLMRELPVRDPQRLVEFIRVSPPSMMTNLPYPVFSYLQRDSSVLSEVFAICPANPVLRAGTGSERARADLVSGEFFRALGVSALWGRTLGPQDGREGNPVAVLSHAFWSRRFGQDPAALGSTIRIDGKPLTIVGVMPPAFFGLNRSRVPDLWVPLPPDAPSEVSVLGYVKPGISVRQAHAALAPLFQQALDSSGSEIAAWPERDRKRYLSQTLLIHSARRGTSDLRWTYWEYGNTLKVVLGLAGLVLLIACPNLANLLMARSANRAREIGIRLGLGAGRLRLVRQLLTENLLVSAAGGALGLGVAWWGHRLLLGFLMREPQKAALDFRLDYRVLCFGLAASVVTCVLFGLMPALRATRTDVLGAIRGDAGRWRPDGVPLARILLPVQVALSMVLLVGAGLFSRSLMNLGAVDLGVARDSLLLIDLSASGRTPRDYERFWTRLTNRLSNVPGVRGVALAGDAVFGNGGWNRTVWLPRPGRAPQDARVCFNLVSPGFFATAGIPVLLGREFGEHDRSGAPLVVVVNQTFAKRFLGGDSAIGKRIGDRRLDANGRFEIVGVVRDARYGSVREQIRPMVFQPLAQQEWLGSAVVHVRTSARPDALVSSIQREIFAADSEAFVSEIRTLPEVIRRQLRQDRMFATLAGLFALLALALAAIGIYGIVAYGVARRVSELGVRVALGAQRAGVIWLVMRETMGLVAIGAVAGAAGALAATRLIRSLLFALEPSDPATLAGAAAIFGAAAGVACFLPARRAASRDPLLALRHE